MTWPERRPDGTCPICWRPSAYSCCNITHLYHEAAQLTDAQLLEEVRRLRENPRSHWVHKMIDDVRIKAFEDHLFGRCDTVDKPKSEIAEFMTNILNVQS